MITYHAGHDYRLTYDIYDDDDDLVTPSAATLKINDGTTDVIDWTLADDTELTTGTTDTDPHSLKVHLPDDLAVTAGTRYTIRITVTEPDASDITIVEDGLFRALP